MSLVDLPPLADAMYKTWWQFADYAANHQETDGSWSYSVTDASSAASAVNRDVYNGQGGYNPIGLSQLFGIARRIGNARLALAAAPDESPILPSHVAEAPWSRPQAEQDAYPSWQARVEITYTDQNGDVQTGTSVVSIEQVLPRNVGALNRQLEERVRDQLAVSPRVKSPKSGELLSIDSVTLLAI